MPKRPVKDTIHAKGVDITIYTEDFQNEFLSLTDIARYKSDEPNDVIKNWMRNRDTIEFLGLWESLHNPDFKPVEFDGFRKEAGLNAFISITYASEADVLNVALFGITAKQWRDGNTDKSGNIRDYATLNQLLVLANMESYNAILIEQGKPQPERLQLLNKLAIRQLEAIQDINTDTIKKLEGK